jgi:hypothetical protein
MVVESEEPNTTPNWEHLGHGRDPERSPIGGDQAGHSGAVAVEIRGAVTPLAVGREVDARSHRVPQVRVSGVNPGVDNGDQDSFALAVAMGLVNVEILKVPLAVPDGVGSARHHGGDGAQEADRCQGDESHA